MEGQNEKKEFSYTYSAKQMEEIKSIRDKYVTKETDKMELLRKLDKKVTQKGTMVSLIIGIIGALVLGVGMCCVLVWADDWFVAGIIIGVIGLIITAVAYPMYQKITKEEKEKLAPEILRLTEELLK